LNSAKCHRSVQIAIKPAIGYFESRGFFSEDTMRLASCLAVMGWVLVGFAQGEEPRLQKPLELTDGWGTIEGQFILEGDVPTPPPPLVRNPPAGVPPVPDERLLIDQESKGIANVVVYLRNAPAAVHPELKQSKVGVVDFKSEDFRFIPHVLHVRTDQKVHCIAADKRAEIVTVGSLQTQSKGFISDIMVGGRTDVATITMARPEPLPVSVKSQLRHWMEAYWVVTDHPYVAITDHLGRFRIEGLPAGEHRFRVWHERVGFIDREWTVEAPYKKSLSVPVVKVPLSRFRTANQVNALGR
jgi:hypothetical protein